MLDVATGRGRPSRDGAGHHRRAPRHAPAGGEGAPPGRRRRRQGLLARSARPRALDARGAAALARAQGVRAPGSGAARSPARTSTSFATRSSATSRTSRSREPSGRTSTVAAAEWIESLGRTEDHAEMLAHHYASALEYARGGRPADVEPLAAARPRSPFGRPAIAPSRSTRSPGRARSTSSRSSSARTTPTPELLLRYGRALSVAGDERREAVLEEARRALLASRRLERRGRGARLPHRGPAVCEADRDEAYAPPRARARSSSGTRPRRQRRRVSSTESRATRARGATSERSALARGGVRDGRRARARRARGARAVQRRAARRPNMVDFDGAIERPRARRRARSLGRLAGGGARLHNLGSTTWFRGDLRRASRLFERGGRASVSGSACRADGSRKQRCLLRDAAETGAWDEALRDRRRAHRAARERRRALLRVPPARIARADRPRARRAEERRPRATSGGPSRWRRAASDRQAMVPVLVDAGLRGGRARPGRRGQADAARELVERCSTDASPARRPSDDLRAFCRRSRSAAGTSFVGSCSSGARPTSLARRRARAPRRRLRAGSRAPRRDRRRRRGVRAAARRRARISRKGAVPRRTQQLQAALAFYRPLGATRYIRAREELLGEPSEIPA